MGLALEMHTRLMLFDVVVVSREGVEDTKKSDVGDCCCCCCCGVRADEKDDVGNWKKKEGKEKR